MLKAVITVCLAVCMPVYTSQCDTFSQQHDFVGCNVFVLCRDLLFDKLHGTMRSQISLIFGKGISRKSFNFSGGKHTLYILLTLITN